MDRMEVVETLCGINLPGHLHTKESLQFAQDFEFRDNDVVIVTYPKSGTTWMQEILTLIYSKGDSMPAENIPNWARAPWLEQHYFKDLVRNGSGPRLITTHLQYRFLAKALGRSKAKVIYITRNPKDVAVSFYHFHKMANFLPDPGSFNDLLKKFLDGTVSFGSWFDHVKGWHNQKNAVNIFYITYEEMKMDLRGSIERLCNFLHFPLLPAVVDSIHKHCTFTNMKDNKMANYTLIPNEIMDHQKGKFMRKGEVGDWKRHFTVEQSIIFDNIYEDEMRGTSLQFTWDL
ncbi:sulfotransferase family 5A, member 1 [Latimeria chalumnae]|uniref:sulfotransferase family 5A, member 1 n=1 Tax=Latimeria chalumnae TaxID=7897 RepID=UPI0003C102CF|nr:PREDICTED: sulfotransferase family cytosolic 2B member 1-like [Latimeria chalumnae]|eukprot:XP_006008319.1 PREDICTED: sulfotransferase family cytosolic 2B member 1-like [Latimeria chalumnae]